MGRMTNWTKACGWVLVAATVAGPLASRGLAQSGVLSPAAAPTAPASQMYTLTDLHNRLATGAAGTKAATFTEPAAAPGASPIWTLDDLMSAAPAVDAANGAAAAQVLAGKSYWGLLSGGGWGLKTGTMPPAPVARTGQTTVYATGDDGAKQKGVANPSPRFTDNANGTVTDNLTKLIWLKNANVWGAVTWATAVSNCNGLASGSAGLTDGSAAGDWRLPNLRELLSLIDYQNYNLAIPTGHPFTNVPSTWYWTSSTFVNTTANAWVVGLTEGYARDADKTNAYVAWPVRGGP